MILPPSLNNVAIMGDVINNLFVPADELGVYSSDEEISITSIEETIDVDVIPE